MRNLTAIGRIFYGTAIAGLGVRSVYYRRLPYMLIPPAHFSPPVLALLAFISGAMLILAGAGLVIRKNVRTISILLGSVLLLVFCFYFIPYEFIVNPNFMQFGEWENAEKELALSGGAFVVAGCFSGGNENQVNGFLAKLVPLGTIVFSLMMICFGIAHFLEPKDVADYIPTWIPFRLFWAYFAGVALIGAGVAIIFKIRPGLIATLLGSMLVSWFVILHIPRVVVSPAVYRNSEIASAFLALAYSGIAFVIAGTAKK